MVLRIGVGEKTLETPTVAAVTGCSQYLRPLTQILDAPADKPL